MCLSREYVETKDILQRPLIVGDRQLSRPLTLSLGMCGHRAEILLRIQQVLLTPGEMDHLNSSERGHFFLCSLEISFKANAQTLHLLIIYVILYIHIYIYVYTYMFVYLHLHWFCVAGRNSYKSNGFFFPFPSDSLLPRLGCMRLRCEADVHPE